MLPDYIEYNHIKIVIALLVRQYGQFVNSEGEIILQQSQSSQDDGLIDLTNSAEVKLLTVARWSSGSIGPVVAYSLADWEVRGSNPTLA